ncbi:delta-aminolevulinic acid dehydratase [candidate division KSB1 bacterium]|nr:delta-aminolevulinic acid dehydratase [candidate division KSB1 bacterium]
MSEIEHKAYQSLQKLIHYVEAEGYAGYDPYDAMNSPILRWLSFNNRWLRISFTQALRRLPWNLRPVLLINKGLNPKALGLFLSGYTRLLALFKEKETEKKIRWLFEKLGMLQSRGFSGACWGYNFPWQNRERLFPIWTPTIVNSSFVGRALIEAYQLAGNQRYLDLARSACNFILNDLKIMHETPVELCLSYTPYDDERVYNSNMLGAAFLAHVGVLTGEEPLLTSAKKMTAFVVNGQNPDGSWVYGKDKTQTWIDIHHTGFVLEALYQYKMLTNDDSLSRAIEKGLEFFVQNFFQKDGRMMSFLGKPYPVDIHSVQAIVTLVKLRAVQDHSDLLEKAVSWIIENMQHERGYFFYRQGRWFNNKIPFMRWAQAWAFHALTAYLKNLRD